MANSTDEYLSIDGESLQTYAYNITTWGLSRESTPPLRGENIVVPGRAGSIFVPKVVASRVISLSMWVQGSDKDGFAPTGGSRVAEFQRNYKNLRRLLFTPDREVTITKRFREYGSDTLIVATGKAQLGNPIQPTMNGRARAIFTVDLEMADPFFYGNEVTVPAFTGVNQQQTITVPGDYRTSSIKLEINGARNSPRIVTTAGGKTLDFRYNYSLGSGDKATVDVPSFEVITTPAAGSAFRSAGLITHSGDPLWMSLAPGSNTLALTSSSGTGSIVVKYKPVWF